MVGTFFLCGDSKVVADGLKQLCFCYNLRQMKEMLLGERLRVVGIWPYKNSLYS